MNKDEDDQTRLSRSDDPTILSSPRSSELDATVMRSSDDATVLSSGSIASSWPSDAGQRLEAGQTFGPYEIIKLLGHGGMGEVHEAAHVETGRRVALKLLRGRMTSHEDRVRFLNEGRLAASISHPHTVYIFGSEEIDGMPVIAMQLLPGGTLKDRVVDRGPMPTVEAVSAILDVIGGLDAAASAGILHRDIKPSNCFVDVDGSVKVGDFGLSISTNAREGQGKSKGFQGTPQYAPPEQLRGEPLDVRADIYAVGATLFYLLTGKPPFESREFQQLIEQVKTQPAPLAHKVRPGIPPPLSALLGKCLAKEAAARPASYAELANALRPFAGLAAPAAPSTRLVAGIIDYALLGLIGGLISSATTRGVSKPKTGVNGSFDVDMWPVIVGLIYFAFCETKWATTLGKRMCGLRVVATTGELSWRQTVYRALIFEGPYLPLVLVALAIGEARLVSFMIAHGWIAGIASAAQVLCSILFFTTMRRRNGYAAVQDLLTNTRVVHRRVQEFRGASAADASSADAPQGAVGAGGHRRFGSFDVGRRLGDVTAGQLGQLFEGTDTVLRRRVWLIESAPGSPEVPRIRRDVDRIGRLHWLSGKRSADENWDAFEAPAGAPLNAAPGESPWSAVQGWIKDLATELAAAGRDKTTPELALDRVWIRPDGRAVLLDFPAPGEKATPAAVFSQSPQFLTVVAELALGNRASMMPVSAVAMVDRWKKKHTTLSMDAVLADLSAVSVGHEKVTRGRRLIPLWLGVAPIVLMMIVSIFALRNVGEKIGRTFAMMAVLQELDKETDPKRRQALETHLAAAYQAELNDEASWKQMIDKDDDNEVPKLRELSRRAATLRPTPADAAAAAYLVQPALDKIERKNDNDNPRLIFVVLALVGCGMAFFPGLISVLVRPSGLVLSAVGFAVVMKSGREVSRFRAVLRLLLAWSPMAVYVVLASVPATRPWVMRSVLPVSIALGLMAVGVIWTILRPMRGPHDIAAGTTIGVR